MYTDFDAVREVPSTYHQRGIWIACVWWIFLRTGFLSCPPLVDADEIKRLGKRFKKLDLDNSGSLSVEEFMSLPELQQNPLVQRVIDIFDTDGNGEVDFKGKICLYMIFSLTSC